jgi:transposase
MEVLYPRCAGLDVHKATLTACVRVAEGGRVRRELREFGTCTRDLLALSDWLRTHGCTHVVLESTGVYWRPVWHVLEGDVELVLANATQVRNVPGRKSDVNDAMWLADLLAHGLIRPSFVPPRATQEVRGLTRTRTQLVREAARHLQRIEKVLEDANLKLTSVLSEVGGVGGRAVLRALADGETNPDRLAAQVTTRVKAARAELVEALRGRVTAYHRFELQLHLRLLDDLEQAIAEVEERLTQALATFRPLIVRLTTIPGISETTARVILGEIGTDMTRFPTAGHLVSWAGLCPRLEESAGKRRSTRVRKGTRWLKTALVQAAWAAVKANGSYLQAQYVRLKGRRGPKKAIVAVAASMLAAIYHIIGTGTPYRDLGATYFDRRDKTHVAKRLVRRLTALGYRVELQPAA